jgi:protocatechuate 3,4-dioxygenase beta subunit
MSPVLLLIAVVAAPSAPDTLAGRITDPDGQPIANARVDIWTGRPKVGIGTL